MSSEGGVDAVERHGNDRAPVGAQPAPRHADGCPVRGLGDEIERGAVGPAARLDRQARGTSIVTVSVGPASGAVDEELRRCARPRQRFERVDDRLGHDARHGARSGFDRLLDVVLARAHDTAGCARISAPFDFSRTLIERILPSRLGLVV